MPQGLLAPFHEDGFLGPGTSLPILGDKRISQSYATDQGVVDMSGVLHSPFIELLVEVVEFMLRLVALPLRVLGQILIDLRGVLGQVGPLAEQAWDVP